MTYFTIDQALELALQHLQVGSFDKARITCESVLEHAPDHPDALHILGMARAQGGDFDGGIDALRKACEICPDDWQIRHNLGSIYQRARMHAEAARELEIAAGIDAAKVQTLVMLATSQIALSQCDKAQAHLQKALSIEPENIAALANLGIVQTNIGLYNAAVESLSKALKLQPNSAVIANNLGVAKMRVPEPEAALSLFQQAMKLDPNYPEPYRNAANLLAEWEHYDRALPLYDAAIRLDDYFVEAHIDKAMAYTAMGVPEDARPCFERALQLSPDSFISRLGLCMSHLASFYETPDDITEARTKYREQLQQLTAPAENLPAAEINEAADAVGLLRPFYLSYHGICDVEEQKLFGRLCASLLAKKYPQLTSPLNMPRLATGERIRVGFVSRQFGGNPVWRMVAGGPIRNINREKFEVHGYLTGPEDEQSARNRTHFDCFTAGLGFDVLCEKIKNDNLHMLIVTDVLMEPMSTKIGSVRLAPVQCLTWGHPETSGLVHVDYFLGSDEVEPAAAADHYTEKLVRLPGLLADLQPPGVDSAECNLEKFGIRDGATIYVCAQSLYKYLPQYDIMLPLIAKQVPNAQFVFIARQPWITEKFKARLRKVFERQRLDFERYVVFTPNLSYAEYMGLCTQAHVFLDTFGFSGGATTLDAIACGLPIVAAESELMRGRQSAAYLKAMGIDETIARDANQYVDIAARLGSDPEWRQNIGARIRAGSEKLYGDMRPIHGLERFIEETVMY